MDIGKGALLRSWADLAVRFLLFWVWGLGVVLGCRPDLGFLFCFILFWQNSTLKTK